MFDSSAYDEARPTPIGYCAESGWRCTSDGSIHCTSRCERRWNSSHDFHWFSQRL